MSMEPIDIKLLHYHFRFRQLNWREESNDSPGKDARRILLAKALDEVSGMKINSFEDAFKLIDALPTPILQRTFIVFKGALPPPRKFTTRNLYKAPDPSEYVNRVTVAEEQKEKAHDDLMQRMETTFSKKELQEAAEVDRMITEGSRDEKGNFRGAMPKQWDEDEKDKGLGGWRKH